MTDTEATEHHPGLVASRGRGAGAPGRLRPGAALVVALAALLGGGGATVVALSREGPPRHAVLAASGLEYSTTALEVTSGEVEITFANTDAVTHTFTVPDLGVDLEVAAGEAGTATFSARPGTYRYVCTVPGHDGPGMRGRLKVR